MSIRASIPRMMKTGSAGKLNAESMPSRITSVARGTPATPLLVSMSVKTITSCCSHPRCTPAACATKIEASAR